MPTLWFLCIVLWRPTLFVYCIVKVVWTSSVVSLLYEAVYSSVSCARFERELRRVRESFGAVVVVPLVDSANCLNNIQSACVQCFVFRCKFTQKPHIILSECTHATCSWIK